MELQTKLRLKKQEHHLIDYNSKIAFFGSCFSEHIANKCNYFKFQNFHNPLGILFHPIAIENLILNAINAKEYSEQDIFFHNERWHSFDAHSSLSHTSKQTLLETLNQNLKATHQFLKDASHVIITLGTAWAYRHIESDSIVANCHKVPQKKFLKNIFSIETVITSLEASISLIRSINPKVNITFTVSPVRHLKDGFIENTQSKSHLISAIHQVIDPRQKLFYFPSYEIMLDELRDYRFYKDDMIHPNDLAIQYIWNCFQEVWISDESLKTMQDVDAIQKGLQHQPFDPNSDAHQSFLQKLKEKQLQLQATYHHISF